MQQGGKRGFTRGLAAHACMHVRELEGPLGSQALHVKRRLLRRVRREGMVKVELLYTRQSSAAG